MNYLRSTANQYNQFNVIVGPLKELDSKQSAQLLPYKAKRNLVMTTNTIVVCQIRGIVNNIHEDSMTRK